jgi:hypothetical protein
LSFISHGIEPRGFINRFFYDIESKFVIMNTSPRNIPYGLKSIEIENFRGINSASLEGIPVNVPWIFLTGNNGYGKTCFLQAVFIGLFGRNRDINVVIENNPFRINAKVEANGIEINRKVESTTMDWFEYRKIPILGYGPHRLSIQASTTSNKEEKSSAQYYSLFNQDGVLFNLETELKSWMYRSDALTSGDPLAKQLRSKWLNVIQVLAKLMPSIHKIEIDPREDKIFYIESDSQGNALPGKRVFDEIASGSKSIFAMIGDMMIRLFRLQEEVTSPSDLEGIVIIDELDLHLHPSWQKSLPSLLSEIFPKIQFIASTHSPIPFLGAPEGSVFLKVNRTPEEGITLEKLDIDISNLNPNLILSSKIFGFTEIFPITHDPKDRIRTEDTMDEKEFNDKIIEKLNSYVGKEKEEKLKNLLKP